VFKNVKTFWMIEMAARRENPYINKNNGLDPLTLEKIPNNTIQLKIFPLTYKLILAGFTQ